MSHIVDEPEVNDALKALKLTVRCLPLAGADEPGRCIFTGKPSNRRAVIAQARIINLSARSRIDARLHQ